MSNSYEDLTLTLSGISPDYRVSARAERGLVVLDEPTVFDGFSVPFIADAITAIRMGHPPGQQEMIAVGSALYRLLFPPPVADLWSKAQAIADQHNSELRLRLEVVADELVTLPWELLYDPQSNLFLLPRVRFSLVRGIARAGVAVRPLQARGSSHVLRLVATPTDRAHLIAGQGDWMTPIWKTRGTVTTLHAATASDLQSVLQSTNPHILHFDGHGGWDEQKRDGYIVLEDGKGNSSEIDGATLFSLLDGSTVRLVVLAACKSGHGNSVKQLSGVAQRLISSGALPAVVAMQYDIPDTAAVRFSEAFYRTLAAGHGIDLAVTEGRKAILLERGEEDSAWATPVLYLRTTSGELFSKSNRPIPFQAQSPLVTDIPRPALISKIRSILVDANTGQGRALVLGVHGAGGYGKTSLARMICHDSAIKTAYPDGVLWVNLGQNATIDERNRDLALVGKVLNWIEALGGERGSVTDLPSVTDRLNKVLDDRRCLLVVDNVWQRSDAIPFLQGVHCAKLITARNAAAFPDDAARIPIAGMTVPEATMLLSRGIAIGAAEQARTVQLAQRLGEYPLLLSLVNRTLMDRVNTEQSPLTDALTYVEDALAQFGVTAFDDEERAVQAVLKISLDLLTADEYARLTEVALFPEDALIPIDIVARLWKLTGGLSPIAADKLLSRLWQLSLLLTLDRRPEQKCLQLHDIVRAYLLEPLDRSAQASIHRQIVVSFGAWQSWKPTDHYLWRWYTYHLYAAAQFDDLYGLVSESGYRVAQQTIVGDSRVALTDVRRALSAALATNELYRTIRLVKSYRQLYRTEQVSDDVFTALDAYKWDSALQIAGYYGTPPRLHNNWVVVLYLQIAFEAAQAGEWQIAESTTQMAFTFYRPPNYPLQRIVDSLHRRIAMVLGQQLADGTDANGWVVRLGAPLSEVAPPFIGDTSAEGQLQRAASTVMNFRHRLVSGESEAISSYDFADEERTEGESRTLGDELARIADRERGQSLIGETLDAVLTNRYPFYRDIALGALGVAVLVIPEGVVVSRLMRRILGTVLNDEGITFEWELPHQLVSLGTSRHINVPGNLHQTIALAHGTRDKWGTHWCTKIAVAATEYYRGDPKSAGALLSAVTAEPPESLYAGYSVLHLLTLHHRFIEWSFIPPKDLVAAAGAQAQFVQDKFTLQPARENLVGFMSRRYSVGTSPTVSELEQLLNEEVDVELQRSMCEYALSMWLAAQPPRLDHVKAMIPHLLDKHSTTLDLYIARWAAIEGNALSDFEIESLLGIMDRYITIPPPAGAYG